MNDSKNNSALSSLQSFEQEFRQWYAPLCKMAFRYTKDKQAAEDIVQDVFTKLWKQRNEITFTISIKSYLYRAVINTSINYIQKQKKVNYFGGNDWNTIDKGTTDTEHKVNFSLLQQQLNKAIDLLPTECRKVFTLSRYEGFNNKEIAEILGISVKTVENQMTKALNTLRKNMGTIIKNSALLIFLAGA